MKRRARSSRREREGGFALLLVFVIAAVLAIALYMEVPRLAFEAQRQKEQMLVERGQQYQIAIRRYMQRGLRQGVNQVVGPLWPTKIEDLENTNGRRFLRKRYIDPMTGQDEWRIIHINNGVLTDSINNKQKQGDQQEGMRAGGIAEFAGLGQTLNTGSPGVSAAVARRRPSEGGAGGVGSGDPNLPANPGDSGGAPAPPAGPAGAGIGTGAGLPPGVPNPLPGQTPPGAGQPGSNGGWGQSSAFGSGTPMPGQPQYPGQIGSPANSNTPGVNPYFPQPGTNQGTQFSPQTLINNLLTQPRQGPMPPPQVLQNGSNTIGGGMAGIASKLDADAIMVCGDHTNYAEWEFIFDPTKWKGPADPRKAVIGTPVGSNQNSPLGGNTQGPNMPQSTPTGMTGPGGGTTPGVGGTVQPGGSQGSSNATCGMEARPGIQ